MCGIAGIYSLDGSKISNLESRVKQMTEMIKYRGPDNVGYYFNKKNSFGMSNNQLSIVSPDKKIKLPFSYNDKTFLSFNGEIYNYKFLKDKFKLQEKNFKNKTDIEVLYHILNLKIKDLSDLNGVWSFAFYNNEEHSLQLSRDLLGERNLYFYKNKKELIFCSEIRPIFSANNLHFNIDNIGLQDMWNYYACRDNKTIIENCFKLKPGTTKTFINNTNRDITHSKLEIEQWIEFFKANNEKKITDKFFEIFQEEINLRYPKKVKSTILLSGGIDSSFTSLQLGKNHKLKTLYAICGDDNYVKRKGITEIDLALEISKKINSNHLVVDLRENVMEMALKQSENTIETIDPAMFNMAQLSNLIKKNNSKVVIGSDGPDDFLCGYPRDINNYLKNKKNSFLRTPYHKIINPLSYYKKLFKKVENKTNYFSEPDDRYHSLLKKLDSTQIKALTYATKSVPEYTNMRLDKSYMLNSLEIRQPFLSKKIVGLLCSLPEKFKINKNKKIGKYFLRNTMKKHGKVSRFSKVGFGTNLNYDDKVSKQLKNLMNETIEDKKIYAKIGIKSETRNFFLSDKVHKGQKYMLFSLIRSVNNLKKNI
jgi:asparagine synthase (glutamine-hydrolysing)